MSRTDRPEDGNPILDFRRRFALWNNLSFWRQWALGGSLAALALLAVVVLDRPGSPHYVAVLQSGGGDPAWLVSASTVDGVLSVRPLGAAGADGQPYELWAISEEGAPRSLGTIRAIGETAIPLDIERARRIAGASALAIGPPGVSPTASSARGIYRGRILPPGR